MDKIRYLKENFFLFNGLSEGEIEALSRNISLNEIKYCHGDIIQNKKIHDKIGIILKGKAVIRSGTDGVIINKIGKNDTFGVASLFDDPNHYTTVIALTDCAVISFEKNFVERCVKSNSTVAMNYIGFLSKKVSFLNLKINAYTAKSAENKLLAYLNMLPRNGNTVELNNDMSTIAKMIGVGRATLYRALEKLIQEGIITKIDKKIIFNEV